MSSIAMSAFATLGRTCLVPNHYGHRFGRGLHTRPIRSSQSFHACQLNRQHMASIAVGLGIITLLLVIFAYHGGYGVGSWFYSLLVVVSGLAFVVFGPLLLCRFLMHAYCRHVEARTVRLQTYGLLLLTTSVLPMFVSIGPLSRSDNVNQVTAVIEPNRPHVYACIIIAPEEITGSFGTSSTLSNLPTYEEAILQKNLTRKTSETPSNVCNNNVTNTAKTSSQCKRTCVSRIIGTEGNVGLSHCATASESTKQVSSTNYVTNETIKDDCPPPTYIEALSIIAQNERQTDSQPESLIAESAVVINIEIPSDREIVSGSVDD